MFESWIETRFIASILILWYVQGYVLEARAICCAFHVTLTCSFSFCTFELQCDG